MKESRHGDGFAERWHALSFAEQMGNVGSEISRVLKWRTRNAKLAQGALERALELIDLILCDPRHRRSVERLREICRVRETMLEFLVGDERRVWTDAALMRYFDLFALSAARTRASGPLSSRH